MTSSDKYTFDKSINVDNDVPEFIYKHEHFVTVNDNNNGSYSSGQIVFDLNTFSNANRFFNAQRSYISIPLVLTVNSAAGFEDDSQNAFVASLKNGSYQIINSLSIQLCNNEVISVQSFQNMYINYKILTTFGTDDLETLAQTLNFAQDGHLSPQFVPDAAGNRSNIGIGICNNVIAAPVITIPTIVVGDPAVNTYSGWTAEQGYQYGVNEGRIKRMQNTSFDPAKLAIQLQGLIPDANALTQQTRSILKNYCTRTVNTVTYYILATIPLKFLSDYFDKLPLIKNAYHKLIINTNTGMSTTLTCNPAGEYIACNTTGSTYGVCPYMISPLNLETPGAGPADPSIVLNSGQGFLEAPNVGDATNQVYTVSLNIVRNTALNISHAQSTCQIIGSLVELTPMYEAIYLENKVKTVVYRDIMSYNNIQGIVAGNPVNTTVTPGLSRMRRVIIIPMISAVVNGQAGSPMNSPFASEPATTSPYPYVTNLNIQLSGTNVYQSNEQYNHQNFLQECISTGAINGGLTPGLNSGLIDQIKHDANYGYITVDLSRHIAEEDHVSKSLLVNFTNASSYTSDYIVLIEYEKTVVVDIELGSIVLG